MRNKEFQSMYIFEQKTNKSIPSGCMKGPQLQSLGVWYELVHMNPIEPGAAKAMKTCLGKTVSKTDFLLSPFSYNKIPQQSNHEKPKNCHKMV